MKKRFCIFAGALCMCILFLSSCMSENRIVGTWTYQTPEWHGMTTRHIMMFWEDGDYEIVCEFQDLGQTETAVERGHYIYMCETLTLTDRVVVDDKHGLGEIPVGADIEYHVVISGNKMLVQMGDYEPVIYRR